MQLWGDGLTVRSPLARRKLGGETFGVHNYSRELRMQQALRGVFASNVEHVQLFIDFRYAHFLTAAITNDCSTMTVPHRNIHTANNRPKKRMSRLCKKKTLFRKWGLCINDITYGMRMNRLLLVERLSASLCMYRCSRTGRTSRQTYLHLAASRAKDAGEEKVLQTSYCRLQ